MLVRMGDGGGDGEMGNVKMLFLMAEGWRGRRGTIIAQRETF